jgi:hypothetical protein
VHINARDVKPFQRHVVHLHEKKVHPDDEDYDRDEDRDVWVLDTGASNHMTGRREALCGLVMVH